MLLTSAGAQLPNVPRLDMLKGSESLGRLGDIRDSMQRLPGPVQYMLTCAIGKSRYPGEVRRRHAVFEVLKYHATYLLGIASGYVFLTRGWWLLLPLSIYLTVVGARHLQVGGVHHMTHGNVTGKRWADDAWGRAISILLLIENYDSYKPGHVVHHSHQLSTEADPTVVTLRSAGLHPGTPYRTLRKRILLSMISPAFHARAVASRVRSYFVGTPAWVKLSATAYLSLLAVLAVADPLVFLLVWFVPHIIGYQSVQIIRAVIEHWPQTDESCRGGDGLLEKTSAIFCAVELPPPEDYWLSEFASVMRWTGLMTVEVVCRYLFVSADGPNHDLHHIRVHGDWANHIDERWEIEGHLARRGRAPLSETWGFFNTLKLHLDAMSAHPEGELS
jgi:hypothetical protein